MFSGHLAQLAVLYETFSGDDSLSRKGFTFQGLDLNYTIDSLLEAIEANSALNGNQLTCNDSDELL